MKIKSSADIEDARERGEILDSITSKDQRERINGRFYYFDCMDGDLSDKYFSVALFDDPKEARRLAYDYEAILTEHFFINGMESGPTIEHTRYFDQGGPYNGDVFAEDIQRQIDASKRKGD